MSSKIRGGVLVLAIFSMIPLSVNYSFAGCDSNPAVTPSGVCREFVITFPNGTTTRSLSCSTLVLEDETKDCIVPSDDDAIS